MNTTYDAAGVLLKQGYTIFKCSICGEEYKDSSGTGPPGGGGGGESGKPSIWDKLGSLLGSAANGFITVLKTAVIKILDALVAMFDAINTMCNYFCGIFSSVPMGTLFGFLILFGEREIKNISGSDYTIKNRDFELTLGIPRNAIEDDKLGLYNPSVQMLGQSAAQHPDQLVFGLLKTGFASKCYDGKPFFSADHPVGKQKLSNGDCGEMFALCLIDGVTYRVQGTVLTED